MNALFEKSPCDCRNKSHVGQSMSKGHYGIFILPASMNALFEKSPCDCRNKSHVGQSMSKGHYGIFILQMSFYGSCFKKPSWPIHFQMPLWQICFAKPILWSHGSKSQVGQSISKCQYMAYTYYKAILWPIVQKAILANYVFV